MSNIGTQCSSRSALFPVEWPLASKTGVTSQNLKKHVTKGIKKRKTRRHRSRLGTNRPRLHVAHATTADQETQTDDKRSTCEAHVTSNEIEYNTRSTSVGGTNDVIYEPAMPCNTVPNIFYSLDRDEATWLAEEVHEANKSVFGAERTAEKMKKKNDELDKKKASLDALQNLLKDLRWNIRYPDEETAKDLDTLDEASGNFGVRNMVNYLGLLDGYFGELQRQLDK